MEDEHLRRAEVRLPPWLNGHDIIGFAKEAQLKLHPVDAAAFRWDIETLEHYESRPARLFELVEVAKSGASPNWSLLENLPASVATHSVDAATLSSERERLLGGGGAPNLVKIAAWVKLSTTAAADSDLIAAVQGGYESLRALPVEGGGSAFPDLAVHFARCDQALARRAALTRVLMRIDEEPELLDNKPEPSGGEIVFGSAWQLQSDLSLTRDAYLAPLLLCVTPWIWAIAAPRIPGVVIYDLGAAIVGRQGEAAELLQLFLPAGSTSSPPRPQIGPSETAAALAWWVEQLNKVFAEVTDLASFVNTNGEYRPRREFEVLLSIEQLGRRLQSILANDRDLATRRLVAFAALDALQGLGVVNFDQACRLSRAESTLEALENGLPAPVAAMLLPVARRAVEALRACQDGFFLSSRVSADGVRLPDKRGGERTVSRADAVVQYLRVLRNASHGFSGENDAERRRDEILLMAHDGNLPGDLAFLPYLYWLEVLANPDRLQRLLRPRR